MLGQYFTHYRTDLGYARSKLHITILGYTLQLTSGLSHAVASMHAGTTFTPQQCGTYVFEHNGQHVKLEVWDTPGNEQCFEKLKDR